MKQTVVAAVIAAIAGAGAGVAVSWKIFEPRIAELRAEIRSNEADDTRFGNADFHRLADAIDALSGRIDRLESR